MFAATQGELSLLPLSVILFILNLASAVQDITVDSIAIRILTPTELGAGNTVQVVAYKLGAVTVGGGLLWVSQSLGYFYMWMLFASVYLVAVTLVLSLNLINANKQKQDDDQEAESSTFGMIKANLRQILRVDGTVWMVCFLLFYKLCERGEAVFPIYLVDKKIPLERLALWTGVIRSIASISGSAMSGYLLSSMLWKPRRVLLAFSSLRVLPILYQTVIIHLWGHGPVAVSELDSLTIQSFYFYSSILSFCLGNLCAGGLTTAAFTAMMKLSQGTKPSLRSTHYALLTTLEVLGKLSFASVSGWLIDTVGLGTMYCLFSCLSLFTVPLVLSMSEKQVENTEDKDS